MSKSKLFQAIVLFTAATVFVAVTGRPAPSHAAALPSAGKTIGPAASSLPGVRFVHIATSGNIGCGSSQCTYIDHPLLNGNPNAIFVVTQNFNPGGGSSGVYNNHAIGVWYDTGQNKWAIFNQDLVSMPVGAAFNVLIPPAGTNVFVHQATSGNTSGHITYINHSLLNGNPNAIFVVTPNWNPGGGSSGVYNNHAIGVWYDTGQNKWAIFNQDLASMPTNAAFNVVVADSTTAFVHKATSGNIVGSSTFIDHPLLNGNPNAIFVVTANFNPGGGSGTYNNSHFNVYYSSSRNKWAIYDYAGAMPTNAAFNVLLPDTRTDVFTHQATSGNTSGHITYINHSLLNNNPNAIFMVTPNWNPPGSSGVYNNHAIGVWYDTGQNKWAIFNQDTAAMPTNAAFNVLIPPPGANVFVHKATSGNIVGSSTFIDHPLLNGNPNAIFVVTPNWNPGGGGSGVYNNHAIGVWYDSGRSQWAIFNEDSGSILNAAFNVLVLNDLTALPGSKSAFVHTATSGNISSNWTTLNHPLTNGIRPAFVFATHNFNPGGGGSGVYNNHAIGVWYDTGQNKWAIFNQDFVNMPTNAAFNVLVIVRRVYLPLVMRNYP